MQMFLCGIQECELVQTPVILTLLLKRFTFDPEQQSYVKLHCDVDVPQTLHIEVNIHVALTQL